MHHPANACQDAETVIVFGITVPQGMLRSPDYNLYLLHRSYHTLYMHLDELVLSLCNFIETPGRTFGGSDSQLRTIGLSRNGTVGAHFPETCGRLCR